MSDFILQLTLFISFGIMVYVASCALPRITDDSEEIKPERTLLSSIPAHKIDLAIASFLEKTLRRARVSILRWDNTLNTYIGKVKSHTANSNVSESQKSLFAPPEENSESDV
ncbi:MAG: hypothetical protein Q8L47_04475 [bacterium]|nr:hypothetical protein [bacterium]